MKLILTILLLSCFQANATDYHVDTSGIDTNNGLTIGTAWKTVAKVNSSTFLPGDRVLFKSGQSWNERLTVPSSGSAGNVITFGSYGTGVKPVITGLQTLSGFTNVGNIWTATATDAVKQLNTVLVAGAIRAKGRTPNTGYSTFIGYSGSPTINSLTTGLTGTPNYTGSEIVVRTTHWIVDKSTITSQSGGTLNFSPGLTYDQPYNGANGFFIQNTASDLDVVGEWIYDSTTKVLKVYSTSSPTVQISTVDTLVEIHGKDYITFDGLSFTGANKAAFQLDTANHITIQNCSINYSGTNGVSGIKSSYCSILNDSIQNSFNDAIYLRQVDPYTPMVNTCDYAIVSNNYIKNTGLYAGMGLSNNGRYIAIYIVGISTTVTNNRIDSSGYIGILFNGTNSLIKNNYITNFGYVKDDGGGIYTVIGGYVDVNYNDGSIIRGNIIANSTGAGAGTTGADQNSGIFLDDQVKLVTVDSNTIYNCYKSGFKLYNANSITLKDNVIVNGIGHGINIQPNYSVTNLDFKRNIVYELNTSYYNFFRESSLSIASMDSNYYSRPSGESTLLNRNGTTYNLSGWQSATGQEAHSSGTPSGVTSATPLFYYNPNQTDSLIYLSGTYIDSKGTSYINSITLQPFTSVVLYYATTQLQQQSIQRFKFYKGQSL